MAVGRQILTAIFVYRHVCLDRSNQKTLVLKKYDYSYFLLELHCKTMVTVIKYNADLKLQLQCEEERFVNLNDSYIDKTYQVVEVTGLDLPVERRLEALGLTEGTSITVLNKKSKGAVIVKVRGTRFAVGRNIAAGIRIKEADAQ